MADETQTQEVEPAIPADEQPTAESTETEPAATTATESTVEPETPAEEEKPQPGTPDKALQQVQQDLSATNRKLDALLEKANAGEKVDPKEVARTQRKVELLRERIGKKTFDMFEEGIPDALAETVVEQDQQIQQLSHQVQQLTNSAAKTQAATTWDALKTKYPGVDVEKVWQTCVGEAAVTIGDDDPVKVQRLADRDFHSRCTNAVKSIAAKQTTKEKDKPLPTPETPVTKGGAQVTVTRELQPPGQPTEEEAYMQKVAGLMKTEK